MKWLGALLLLGAGAAVGFGKIAELRREAALLEELAAFLRYLRDELLQRGTPLPDILQNGGCWQRLPLAAMEKRLRAGQTAAEALRAQKLPPERETTRILEELCTVLGCYDSATQSAACGRAIERLEARRGALLRQLEEKGSVYRAVPLALGLMAALVLC